MLIERNFFNLLYLASRQKHDSAMPSYYPGQMSSGFSIHAENHSGRKTIDLIGKLLGYGARASRSAQSPTHIAVDVFMPNGKRAVRLKMTRPCLAER
jgi:hypothetical protein